MADEILFQDEWLALKRQDGWYTYVHEVRTDGRLVAVLGFRGNEIVGRIESTPPHRDGFQLCALTGGIEIGKEPWEAAVQEFAEEAGISIQAKELIPLGFVRPSKAADTVAYLYAVDVGDREIGEAVGDGTRGEEGAYCKWISFTEAVNSKDPLLATMAIRLFLRSGS